MKLKLVLLCSALALLVAPTNSMAGYTKRNTGTPVPYRPGHPNTVNTTPNITFTKRLVGYANGVPMFVTVKTVEGKTNLGGYRYQRVYAPASVRVGATRCTHGCYVPKYATCGTYYPNYGQDHGYYGYHGYGFVRHMGMHGGYGYCGGHTTHPFPGAAAVGYANIPRYGQVTAIPRYAP